MPPAGHLPITPAHVNGVGYSYLAVRHRVLRLDGASGNGSGIVRSISIPEPIMARPISPLAHGVIDYTTAATVAAAPFIFDFPAPARRLCESLAASYTGLSATTDYPLGVARRVPFKVHGGTELVIGLALPALPWLLGFSQHRAARNFCFGLAALTFVVAALTDWDAES